jgi:cytochrome P450
MLASANRDERKFPDADRFDILRDTAGHLGFGFGLHFCLGSALARLQARAALEAVMPHLARLQRRDDAPAIIDSFLVRGRSSLVLQELPRPGADAPRARIRLYGARGLCRASS